MHPGAEDVYSASIDDPSTEADVLALVECGMYDLADYLAERVS